MNPVHGQVRDALAGLSGRSARIVAEEVAQRTGLSVRSIYRITRDVRGNRSTRADHGKRRHPISDATRDVVMKLVHHLNFDATLAIETAVGNGLVASADAPAPGTLNRWMREDGVGTRRGPDAKVCRRFEAPEPNALHQCDSTISNTWYLADDGSVGYEPLRDQSNKPGNKRPRLNLFCLVDDYSRVTYARYYLAENTLNWLDFLWHAWGECKHSASATGGDREALPLGRFPFCGVPEVLYTDNGSCLNSARFKTACRALGVDLKFHEPFHAQSKGKVERAILNVQRKLERLTLLKKPSSLDEANSILFEFLVRWNQRTHSTTREQPFARWLDRSSAIRRLPEAHILRALNCTHITRVLAADLTFSIAGETFQAPYREPFRSMPRGQKITVEYAPECPFEVNIVVGNACIPALHVAKGRPLPVELPAASAARTRTRDTEDRLAGTGLEHLTPFGVHEAQTADLRYLPQASEAIEVAAEVPELELSEIKVTRILQDAGIVSRPPGEAGRMLVIYLLGGKESVPESTVTKIVRTFTGKDPRTVLAALVGASGGEATAATAG